jgi:hypothetical protein
LLKILSAKLFSIFKNLIQISMVYLSVHRSLKSLVLRLIMLLRKIDTNRGNARETLAFSPILSLIRISISCQVNALLLSI